jgi:hypothetical protein
MAPRAEDGGHRPGRRPLPGRKIAAKSLRELRDLSLVVENRAAGTDGYG